jgi:hypothetical protein
VAVLAVVLLQATSLGLENILRNNLMLFPLLYLLPVAAFAVGMRLMYRKPTRAPAVVTAAADAVMEDEPARGRR